MRVAMAVAAALLAGTTRSVPAATFFSPFATLGYQHNSNVFMRPTGMPAFAGEGITALGDSILNYEAGLNTEYDWGPADQLTLGAEATRYQYDRFSSLNHNEYDFSAGLVWRLGPLVDGTANFRQSHFMAPFTETFTTQLLVDTERTADVMVRVLMTPEWRLDLTPRLHDLDTPLPGFPDFKLHETTGIAGLDYLGFGRLTAGVQFIYDDGRYERIAEATRYQQHEADVTASYKLHGFSTFSFSAGYTTRNSEANTADSVPLPGGGGTFGGFGGTLGKTSSFSGSLTYQRQLTGKTSANLSLFRRVDSYAAGANPEIGTGGQVGVTWKPDPKFTFNLKYGLTQDQIQGGLVVLSGTNRTDRAQTAVFEARYLALSWLTIRPYVNWARARSNFTLGNYSATIVGIDVTAQPRW